VVERSIAALVVRLVAELGSLLQRLPTILQRALDALLWRPFVAGQTPVSQPTCDDLAWHERVSIRGIRMRSRSSVWLRSFLRPGAWLAAIVVAGSGVAQLLRAQKFPKEATWQPGTHGSLALVGLGAGAILAYLLVTLGYGRALKKSEQNAQLNAVCKDAAALVVARTGLNYDVIGVHVWAIRGPFGFRHLERRAQFVLKRRRASPVTWRKGKGAMGICWKRNSAVVADVEELEGRCPTRAEFCALPRDGRWGLTWEEFRETRHYRAILSIPLRGGPQGAPRLRGVLSVDAQEDGHAQELRLLVSENRFTDILSLCEDVLGRATGVD
jgi:hypothetical protein